MTSELVRASLASAVLTALLISAPMFAQRDPAAATGQPLPAELQQPDEANGRGHGMMRGGMMDAAGQHADMQLFQALFAHRTEITRRVTTRPDGVESVTESTTPEVTRLLQQHVVSMLARVKESRPIHLRDPLFVEVFRYADRIDAQYDLTPKGIHVVETSRDPYVAKLLQAHAAVVDAFIANGHAEMMKNHALPPR
jgi:hypothetical protein